MFCKHALFWPHAWRRESWGEVEMVLWIHCSMLAWRVRRENVKPTDNFIEGRMYWNRCLGRFWQCKCTAIGTEFSCCPIGVEHFFLSWIFGHTNMERKKYRYKTEWSDWVKRWASTQNHNDFEAWVQRPFGRVGDESGLYLYKKNCCSKTL